MGKMGEYSPTGHHQSIIVYWYATVRTLHAQTTRGRVPCCQKYPEHPSVTLAAPPMNFGRHMCHDPWRPTNPSMHRHVRNSLIRSPSAGWFIY